MPRDALEQLLDDPVSFVNFTHFCRMPPKSKFLSSLKSPVPAKHKKPSVTVSKKTPVKASSVYKQLVAGTSKKSYPSSKMVREESSEDEDDELMIPDADEDDEEEDDEEETTHTTASTKSDSRFDMSKFKSFESKLEDADEVRFDDDDAEAEEDGEEDEDDVVEEAVDAAEEEDEEDNAEEIGVEQDDEDEEEEEEEEVVPAKAPTRNTKSNTASAKSAASNTAAAKAVDNKKKNVPAQTAAEDSEDEDEALLSLSASSASSKTKPTTTTPPTAAPANAEDASSTETKKPILDVHSAKAKKKAEAFLEKQRQRGIVYLSRIPPQMGPRRIRLMLSPYGDIDRIFLQPEDVVKTLKRKKSGGGGKRYEGGWVEFLDKRKAKRAALLLHGAPMAAKKRNKFANDLWQMKYLKGVKWEDLRLQHMHEKEMREAALRTEIMQAKKEASEYVEKVEAATKRQKMLEAKKRRGDELPEAKVMRTFHQRTSISKAKDFDE